MLGHHVCVCLKDYNTMVYWKKDIPVDLKKFPLDDWRPGM